MPDQIIRASILNPRASGHVEFIRDGVIHADASGRIAFIGEWSELGPCLGPAAAVERCEGIILPPFFDNHIHIPQHPIRGQFMKDIPPDAPGGSLLAGLKKNVFPAEARCHDRQCTEQIVQDFLADTLSNGVVGGAAYMTVHAEATEIALEMLPSTWRVGMVLMNQQPDYLRTDEPNLDRDIRHLARRFGERFIVTDRFAISTDSPLRQRASRLARELGLRMQTHLNEQQSEKHLVERVLYPDADSYTDVYRRDGLLDCSPILAHCIHMRPDEYAMVRDAGAVIAHCPTSNTLLGSGIMNLDEVISRGIDYAICTDVGASPTTSILQEMVQYLKIHRDRSRHATPSEALYRSTLGPARMLGLNDIGTFEVGMPLSFIEIHCNVGAKVSDDSDAVILSALLNTSPRSLNSLASEEAYADAMNALANGSLDAGQMEIFSRDIQSTQSMLENQVQRVVISGQSVWRRGEGREG